MVVVVILSLLNMAKPFRIPKQPSVSQPSATHGAHTTTPFCFCVVVFIASEKFRFHLRSRISSLCSFYMYYYYYCRDMCLLIKLSTCVIWQFSCAYVYNAKYTDLVPTMTTTQSTGKISLHIKRLNPKTEENFFSILSSSPGRLCVGGV